jgi:hypothetical protein
MGIRSRLGLGQGAPYALDAGKREYDLSNQLVRLVDVVYALVLVQGAVYYRRVFTEPGYFSHSSRFGPVVLALILVYYITIQSFVDYHLAAEDQPYRILSADKRNVDLFRFYFDLVIVGSYSLFLLKCHPLIHEPGADIHVALWTLPGIFALYWIWGELRKFTSETEENVRKRPYAPSLLLIMLVLFGVLAFAYGVEPGGSLRNSCALAAGLVLMLVFRVLNWPQNRHYGLAPGAENPPVVGAGEREV